MDQQLKVAFLTPEFPHPKISGLCGGIGTSIQNLGSALAQRGVKVSIIVYNQETDGFFEADGFDFYTIRNNPSHKRGRYKTQKKIEKLLRRLVREDRVNLVEAPDWTGITAFIQPKCPVVVKVHGSETYFAHLAQRPIDPETARQEKRALRKADALLAVSQFSAEVTQSVMALRKDFKVIPNGIDIGKFHPQTQHDPTHTILYFGTLVRKKGTLELPHIFNKVVAQNPSVQLILVGLDSNDPVTGKASVWQMMQPMFSETALKKVTYAGSVAYDKIAAYIDSADVCVFPSYAEALPVSWMEAMAMGKAIVASAIGWASEMITDGKDGFLVHPTQHQHYADRIVQLLENADLRQSFGQQARKTVQEKFDFEKIAQQHVSAYAKILQQKPAYNWRKYANRPLEMVTARITSFCHWIAAAST
ncbi:glycosyltransferase family 4 protein [Flavobacterium sp.]|uniref:glycosyltransferase family 4 protein n=1 Tax=Flavobacterium sp. TaxID=239 RepID=UPI0039E22C2D